MSNSVRGIRTLSMTTDREGNRTYKVRYLVQRTSANDGPAAVLSTAGLPAFGAPYSDGKSDADIWAFCTFESEVSRHEEKDGEVGYYWSVVKTFTTVSPRGRDLSRMAAAPGAGSHPPGKGDPTDQDANPPQVSVSFVRYTEEAVTDYLDRPILNSAHEFIRGQKNEWDMNRVQIKIKQSVSSDALQLPALVNMVDTVNSLTIWGFPPRTVKLSEAPVEWRYHSNGRPYYDRSLTFDVRYRARQNVTSVLSPVGTGTSTTEELVQDEYYETWDRYVADEGTKVLNGYWGPPGSPTAGRWVLKNVGNSAPDPANPNHFTRAVDRNNNPVRMLLDGGGLPADTIIVVSTGSGGVPDETTLAPAGRRLIKFYGQSDFSKIPHLPTSLVPLVVP